MRIAAVTMVFNEQVFLPIWLTHYGQAVGYQNLFVIDDGSDDGSTSDSRILNIIRRPRGELDEAYRARLISRFHEKLLKHYDVVIFTDADELIVVDPDVDQSIASYLESRDFGFLNPIGLNVVHRVEREPPINLGKPLLAQRRYMKFSPWYSKPAIARIPMDWLPGFHRCRSPQRFDRNLLLFHLRSMDVGVARERLRTLNSIVRSLDSRSRGYSRHFAMSEAEYFRQYIPNDADFRQAGEAEMDLYALGIEPSPERSLVRVPGRFRKCIVLSEPGAPESPASPGMNEALLRSLFDEADARAKASDPT